MSTDLVPDGGSDDVVDGPTLAELGAIANSEHAATVSALGSALLHAIACGEALRRAEAMAPDQAWLQWLDENFDGDRATANNYVRLATYRDRLGDDESLSIKRALGRLSGLPHVGRVGVSSTAAGDEVRAEAARLRAQGLSYRDVGAALGRSRTSVQEWLDPEFAARARQRKLAYKARRRSERRALKEQSRRDTARASLANADSAMAELYAMAERMQDVMGKAHARATDNEARRALAAAGLHYRKMRDEIVRALGVS